VSPELSVPGIVPGIGSNFKQKKPGNDLLSHQATLAVPSAPGPSIGRFNLGACFPISSWILPEWNILQSFDIISSIIMGRNQKKLSKPRILVVKKSDSKREIDFELDYLASLPLAARFKLMAVKSRELKINLDKNGHPQAPEILKRP